MHFPCRFLRCFVAVVYCVDGVCCCRLLCWWRLLLSFIVLMAFVVAVYCVDGVCCFVYCVDRFCCCRLLCWCRLLFCLLCWSRLLLSLIVLMAFVVLFIVLMAFVVVAYCVDGVCCCRLLCWWRFQRISELSLESFAFNKSRSVEPGVTMQLCGTGVTM